MKKSSNLCKLASMIPVFDIKRQNKIIGKEVKIALLKTADSGSYILGSKVAEFEEKFAQYLGVMYAVGVANGTDAISLALLALGIKPGDGVILPANSYPSVFAVTAIGAVPQPVDVDPITHNINPQKIPAAITKKTKAILPVHLYGQPANMDKILNIGRDFDLPVVEDCAQAHGAEIKITQLSNYPIIQLTNNNGIISSWRKVGTIGDIGCFSFYPTKNLGCFGDGGMVVTNNPELAERVRMLRMYGERDRYKSVMLGRNSRLDEMQAAILLVKLRYLDNWNENRRKLAQLYKSQISNLKSHNHHLKLKTSNIQNTTYNIQFPSEADYAKHIFHLFVVRTKKRDKLKSYLSKQGIQTAVHYPTPFHLVPSMQFLGYKKGDFPECERACREVLSLPMFPELKEDEVKRILAEIKNFNDLNH